MIKMQCQYIFLIFIVRRYPFFVCMEKGKLNRSPAQGFFYFGKKFLGIDKKTNPYRLLPIGEIVSMNYITVVSFQHSSRCNKQVCHCWAGREL